MIKPFQDRVNQWTQQCFGPEIAMDPQERSHRFIEESLELVQSCGTTVEEAHQLVDYVYSRPVGEKGQEVGGALLTLAALCTAHDFGMEALGELELARVWTKIDIIRAKQAAKPKNSPLPEANGSLSGPCPVPTVKSREFTVDNVTDSEGDK